MQSRSNLCVPCRAEGKCGTGTVRTKLLGDTICLGTSPLCASTNSFFMATSAVAFYMVVKIAMALQKNLPSILFDGKFMRESALMCEMDAKPLQRIYPSVLHARYGRLF